MNSKIRRITAEEFSGILAACCMFAIIVMLIFGSVVSFLQAGQHTERDLTREIGPKYQAWGPVKTDDGCYCDLVTNTEAIEVDWCKKFYEAVGQALFYSIKLEKEPAIILLRKNEADQKYIDRCQLVCDKYQIKLYVEDVGAYTTNATERVGN